MKKELKLLPLREHLSPPHSYSQAFTPPAEIDFRSALYLVSHGGALEKRKMLDPRICLSCNLITSNHVWGTRTQRSIHQAHRLSLCYYKPVLLFCFPIILMEKYTRLQGFFFLTTYLLLYVNLHSLPSDFTVWPYFLN